MGAEGTPFRQKEVDGAWMSWFRLSLTSCKHADSVCVCVCVCVCVWPAFLTAAKDLETGNIYYEDYIAMLTAESSAS